MLSTSLAVTPCKWSSPNLKVYLANMISCHDVQASGWRKKQITNRHSPRISQRRQGESPGHHQNASPCLSTSSRRQFAGPSRRRGQETRGRRRDQQFKKQARPFARPSSSPSSPRAWPRPRQSRQTQQPGSDSLIKRSSSWPNSSAS